MANSVRGKQSPSEADWQEMVNFTGVEALGWLEVVCWFRGCGICWYEIPHGMVMSAYCRLWAGCHQVSRLRG